MCGGGGGGCRQLWTMIPLSVINDLSLNVLSETLYINNFVVAGSSLIFSVIIVGFSIKMAVSLFLNPFQSSIT